MSGGETGFSLVEYGYLVEYGDTGFSLVEYGFSLVEYGYCLAWHKCY